jgi:hypothetical protein
LFLGELNINFFFWGIVLRSFWVIERWEANWMGSISSGSVWGFWFVLGFWVELGESSTILGVLCGDGGLHGEEEGVGDGVRILAPLPLVRAILILWKKMFRDFWNEKCKKRKKGFVKRWWWWW